MTKVPKTEAPGVFGVDKANSLQLKKGQWIMISMPGLYKDDFAKVADHDPETKKVWVRIIPRLETRDTDL